LFVHGNTDSQGRGSLSNDIGAPAGGGTERGVGRGMALGGDAVFRLDDGRVVFVPRGAPGDVAAVTLTGATRGVLHGRLAALEQPGSGRVEAPCPFFRAGCGGCQWQQLSYESQLDQKQQMLGETLRRLGKLESVPLLEPVPAPDPWHYRTAIQLHVDAEGRVAFTGAHSHDLIPIDACLIAHPLLNRLITALGAPLVQAILRDRVAAIRTIAARVATADGQDQLLLLIGTHGGRPRAARRLLEALRSELPEITSASVLAHPDTETAGRRRLSPVLQPLVGEPFLPHDAAGHRFFVGPLAFFQVNAAQTEQLLAIVRDVVAAERPYGLLDLYCGVGLFALTLAELTGEVIGYDAQPEAIHLAERALETQLLRHPAGSPGTNPRVRFHRGDIETLQPEDLRGADVVILDPPRSGLPGALIDTLVASTPPCLIYVSCEPSSLARDLRRLVGAGWRLDSVQLLDMFPQTYHIESVSVLRRS
jgi:23S rRNA (uracil1939-C5)-methyltransferase